MFLFFIAKQNVPAKGMEAPASSFGQQGDDAVILINTFGVEL